MKKKILTFCAVSVTLFSILTGCTSSKNYVLPAQAEYQGYKIIDAVDKDTVFTKVSLSDQEKIAVVMRDIATTSYSFIEPRYMNSMVHYDGKSQCCSGEASRIGNSGLVVYKFSFIGKGATTINIIARQKGLSVTTNNFETDHVYTVNVDIK